ncbi:hypothetical protein SDJN02_27429, partial [Cucurbita argyrosperma subsp. argyrosperma]
MSSSYLEGLFDGELIHIKAQYTATVVFLVSFCIVCHVGLKGQYTKGRLQNGSQDTGVVLGPNWNVTNPGEILM